MKTQVKKMAILARPGPGFMGGALLAMLLTVSPVHAGWLVEGQKVEAFGAPGSIAISGDTAVVGIDTGNSAEVYVRNGATWSHQATLMQGVASVAISGDTIVASATRSSASVFVRSGDTWIKQATLTAPGADGFESSKSNIAFDGDTVVIGDRLDDDGGNNSGAAYVFVRSGTTWVQREKLTASNAAVDDGFGEHVAVEGNTVVVGGRGRGAYVFTLNGAGWSEQTKLLGDRHISSVAVADDTILVGVQDAAYVFTLNSATWSQKAELTASVAVADEEFGGSVALFGDTAVVGARIYNAGSAYVFSRNGTTWSEQTKLKALDNGPFGFGSPVAISVDTAMVGSSGFDIDGYESGEVFFFHLSCETTFSLPNNQWRQISLPCNPGANNTVTAVFGDDIPGTYGTDWTLYRYDTSGYIELAVTDPLSQGVGYWIIQKSGSDVVLDMPKSSTPTPVTSPTGCLSSAKGCVEIPLNQKPRDVEWNMIGYPFASSGGLSNTRVLTDPQAFDDGGCTSGCDLDTANAHHIVHNQLWTYNGSAYTTVDSSGNLNPWKGYWIATGIRHDADNPRLLVPKP